MQPINLDPTEILDMNFETDKEKLDTIEKELFSCVIGDVMDGLGHTHQYLPSEIRPLRDGMTVVGRAKTVLEADCAGHSIHHENREAPFGVMLDALDSMKENEVYVCAGASPNYALWGELMSYAARYRGAVGAVMEGYSRDTKGICEMGFPTFSFGSYGQDQGVRGRVIDYDCPIRFSNQVKVCPGDIVVGDIDGVVVIPKSIENEVIAAALEKVSGENIARKRIQEGTSTRQVWDELGIL